MVSRSSSTVKAWVSRSAVERRGGILILSLWSLCLLTTFAVILGNGVRQKIILVQRLDERGKLRFIAEAGVKRSVVELNRNADKTYDSLRDAWSSNISAFKGVSVGDGVFDVCADYRDGETGMAVTRYGVIDEERKININTAGREVLERLFRVVLGFHEIEAQELAASLIDWRDGDSELSIPLGSAEDRDYRNLQYPYEAKDAPFDILEEALLVRGMTREAFEGLRGYISIYGSGRVNINTAPRGVLLALGLTERLAAKILLFRQGEDGVAGTADDNVFEATSKILPRLSQFSSLTDSEAAELSRVVDYSIVTSSDNFMIRSVARLKNRKNTSEARCVVRKDGRILYWQEL